jgi:lipopolysaccharide/colanic/teichoic acid biosynthesis glycosyltransferase
MIKRLFDIVCSTVGLLILSPLFIVLSLCIYKDSKGPLLFHQLRIGKNGKPFYIHKFRTMIQNAELLGERITVKNDPRITKCGKILRKYKLDELPQLFNVLKGEMSIVGPRPEVPEYVDLYPEDIKNKVLSVLPGITDLAAVEYRSENDMLLKEGDPRRDYIERILPKKLELYVDYIDKRSLLLDLSIILRTIIAIIR